MPLTDEEAVFNQEFCARVKAARVARGWTAEQMAVALGIPAERYRKYESRSPLPVYLLERFALIADLNLAALLASSSNRGIVASQEVIETKRIRK